MHQRSHQRTGLTALVALVLGLGLVYGLVQLYQSGSAPAGPATPVAAGAPAPAPAQVGLATAVTPLGTVVTSDGFTLYRFDKDTAKPPVSNCKGQCATTWPPLLSVDGKAPAIEGVDKASVGTVKRADGTTQVTLKGWPLYRFSGDAAPGDTSGEGVGGTWHAIGVDGKPVSAAAPARPAAPAPAAPAPAPAQEDYPSYDSGY